MLVSLGGGDVYQAKTLLYLGQPFTAAGGGQILSLQTNPKAVSEIIRSEAAIGRAARAAGLRPAQLRGNVTSTPSCRSGRWRASRRWWRSVRAPTRRGRAGVRVVREHGRGIVPYVDNKMVLLREAHRRDDGARSTAARIAAAHAAAAARAQNNNLSLAERLLIPANINTTLQFYEQRSQVLRAEQAESEQLLSLAEVEQTRVLQEGVGVRTDATSRRNAMAVGGLLGPAARGCSPRTSGSRGGAPERAAA